MPSRFAMQAAVQSKFSLLLVECFAGSHPVAKVAKQINEASGSTRLRVAAYVGIELDPASKHAKPTPSAEYLGLSPESWLALNGEEEVSKQPSDIQAESAGNIANLETQVRFITTAAVQMTLLKGSQALLANTCLMHNHIVFTTCWATYKQLGPVVTT